MKEDLLDRIRTRSVIVTQSPDPWCRAELVTTQDVCVGPDVRDIPYHVALNLRILPEQGLQRLAYGNVRRIVNDQKPALGGQLWQQIAQISDENFVPVESRNRDG